LGSSRPLPAVGVARSFSADSQGIPKPTIPGRRLETAFGHVGDTPELRAAIDKYGACLDRQIDDVSKGCCEIEFQELNRLIKKVLSETSSRSKTAKQ